MTGLYSPADEYKRKQEQAQAGNAATNGTGVNSYKRAKIDEGAAGTSTADHSQRVVVSDEIKPPAQAAFPSAPTAGAAAAMAAAAAAASSADGAANNSPAASAAANDYDVYNSAKMAAETVEAIDLPDTDTLVPATNPAAVREMPI